MLIVGCFFHRRILHIPSINLRDMTPWLLPFRKRFHQGFHNIKIQFELTIFVYLRFTPVNLSCGKKSTFQFCEHHLQLCLHIACGTPTFPWSWATRNNKESERSWRIVKHRKISKHHRNKSYNTIPTLHWKIFLQTFICT